MTDKVRAGRKLSDVTMKLKVLVIDDHAQTRQLVKWALGDAPFEIYEASNGEAGLKMAAHLHPQLVVLDVVMPGERDGYEVCKALRTDAALPGVKIILLSSNDRPEDRERGWEAGAHAYLTKPFTQAILRSEIVRLLSA